MLYEKDILFLNVNFVIGYQLRKAETVAPSKKAEQVKHSFKQMLIQLKLLI